MDSFTLELMVFYTWALVRSFPLKIIIFFSLHTFHMRTPRKVFHALFRKKKSKGLLFQNSMVSRIF
jgi:hypothetical protein